MKQSDFWDRLWQEAKVILGIAGGITTALWIKRLIEKLSSHNIIDKDIVEHGLDKRVPVPVISPPPSSSSSPAWWHQPSKPSTPWWQSGQRREGGSGEVMVD